MHEERNKKKMKNKENIIKINNTKGGSEIYIKQNKSFNCEMKRELGRGDKERK